MVEFPVGQSCKPPRCPEKQHYRLGIEGEAVQAVAVARPGDSAGQILDLLGGKHAVNKRPERANPNNAPRCEAFTSSICYSLSPCASPQRAGHSCTIHLVSVPLISSLIPDIASLSNRDQSTVNHTSRSIRRDRRCNDHILCREAPLSHPDAGSLKVLEHKMPRICGGGGSRDVVLKHYPAHFSSPSGAYQLGH